MVYLVFLYCLVQRYNKQAYNDANVKGTKDVKASSPLCGLVAVWQSCLPVEAAAAAASRAGVFLGSLGEPTLPPTVLTRCH